MKRYLTILIFLLCALIGRVSFSYATDKKEIKEPVEFIYDDKGNRDPFWPLVSSEGVIMNYDAEFIISDLVLEGVMLGTQDNSLAIINGKVLKLNDQIGNFFVGEIHANSVVLVNGQDRFELKITKEE